MPIANTAAPIITRARCIIAAKLISSMSDTVGPYDAKAGILAARYETVRADAAHAALLQYIPNGPDLIALDVGAGSGRDAAWLASLGYDVVAVEPAAGMRVEGQRRHPDP